MNIGWDAPFHIVPIASTRIVEDASLVDYVEDWSKVRSPARASRRRKLGFPQRITMRAVPQNAVYSIDNGRTLVMHPEVARAMERRLASQMDHSIERAIMTGKL